VPAPGTTDDDRPEPLRTTLGDHPGRRRTDAVDPRDRGEAGPVGPRDRRRDYEPFAAWWRGGAEGELRAELLSTWDPIGVADDPAWPADEYDRYLLRLVGVLQGGAAPERLAAELGAIEREELGLTTADADPRVRAAGSAIHAWYAGAAPAGGVRRDGAGR
jgi:hypothetical protein